MRGERNRAYVCALQLPHSRPWSGGRRRHVLLRPLRTQGRRNGATRSHAMSRSASADLRIGVSGWRYAPWRGVFYPADLPQRLELWYASRIFSTIELNGSFYSLQRPEYFEQWYQDTPNGFCFAVKGPRFITHMKRLRDGRTPLA